MVVVSAVFLKQLWCLIVSDCYVLALCVFYIKSWFVAMGDVVPVDLLSRRVGNLVLLCLVDVMIVVMWLVLVC